VTENEFGLLVGVVLVGICACIFCGMWLADHVRAEKYKELYQDAQAALQLMSDQMDRVEAIVRRGGKP
jgi:hypothetical protein